MTAWSLRSASLVGGGFVFMSIVREGVTTPALIVALLSGLAGVAHVLVKG
jgi:hypothetical protein